MVNVQAQLVMLNWSYLICTIQPERMPCFFMKVMQMIKMKQLRFIGQLFNWQWVNWQWLNRQWLTLQCMLLLSTCLGLLVAPQTHAQSTSPNTIVVYGDSLSAAYGIAQTAGWVHLLQQKLIQEKRDYQVVNASISGETTSGGLSRFATMLRTHKPRCVVLELGANDGLRGLNLAVSEQNLASMIQQAQQQGAQVVLLGMKIPPNYGLKYTQQFSDMYRKLAQQYSLQWVPFFLAEVAGNPALVQSDGLHPTATAQPQLLKNVWPYVLPLLKP